MTFIAYTDIRLQEVLLYTPYISPTDTFAILD